MDIFSTWCETKVWNKAKKCVLNGSLNASRPEILELNGQKSHISFKLWVDFSCGWKRKVMFCVIFLHLKLMWHLRLGTIVISGEKWQERPKGQLLYKRIGGSRWKASKMTDLITDGLDDDDRQTLYRQHCFFTPLDCLHQSHVQSTGSPPL